jgi:predicted enzyme related to lactoylglutathione lyase
MMGETPRGRFCWYDLMTAAPHDAPKFYGAVTGWGTAPFDGAGEPYTMWMNGEAPIGGIMQLSAEAIDMGAPPHWLAYVSTPDVKGTARRARELGATVMAEMDIPTVGSVAMIRDPFGAAFAAFQPIDDTPGHDGPPRVGEVAWNELITDDPSGAWAFYTDLFGWDQTGEMDMGEVGVYRMFGRAEQPRGGMMGRGPRTPALDWVFYIRVADIHKAVEAVRSAGGEVWNEPMEIPGGDLVAHCRDPQGAVFALHYSEAD